MEIVKSTDIITKIANFTVTPGSIRVTKTSANNVSLNLPFAVNFDNMGAGIGANTNFIIESQYDPSTHTWRYVSSSIRSIRINRVSIPGIADISGQLVYRKTGDVGQFYGDLTANFLSGMFEGNVKGEFGHSGSLKYWNLMVDAQLTPLSSPPFLGLQLRAIGGGAYYNMDKVSFGQVNSIGQAPQRLSPLQDFFFIPSSYGGKFGVMANVAVSTIDQYTFNGRLSFSCSLSNGMVSSINLSGEANLMNGISYSSLTSTELAQGEININGRLTYNFNTRTFTGIFGYDIDMGTSVGKITGTKRNAVDILISPNRWHFNIGDRQNPCPLNLTIAGNTFESNSYINLSNNGFNFGTSLYYAHNFNYNPELYNPVSWWYDHYRLRIYASLDLDGQISRDDPLCSNHPIGDYFFYLGGGINFGYKFYARDNGESNWHLKSRGSFGVNTKLYFPNPSGFYFGINSETFGNPNFTIGEGCR